MNRTIESVHVLSRVVGELTVRPDQILEFVAPMFGFEPYRLFVIVPDPKAPPFHWLQSVEEGQLAFPIVAAEELGIAYGADRQTCDLLRIAPQHEPQFWVVVTLPGAESPIRLNLCAPVVVNPVLMLAAQIIAREDYPVSYSLQSSAANPAGRTEQPHG